MRPILALTQGDPAGIGPEILLGLTPTLDTATFCPLLIAERAALESVDHCVPNAPWDRIHPLDPSQARRDLRRAVDALPANAIPLLDPVGEPRTLEFGQPGAADGRGALAALDLGIELTRAGAADALVTAPINKAVIARHQDPGFRGHTDYLAQAAGLGPYGRDYLMTFLAPNLRVALLTVHIALEEVIAAVTREAVLDALRCLHRHLPEGQRRIAVAALDPHVGEEGLIGTQDDREVRPAVAAAREEGIDAHGPESADSLFARASQGEFDWVLALYHDQGLVAVKTAAFGVATNWTLGLPFLRTSVDHGTAYGIAGQGRADIGPMEAVIRQTLDLLNPSQ